MLRKFLLLIFILSVSVTAWSGGQSSDTLSREEVLAGYMRLSRQQIKERADEYFDRGELAEANMGYGLLINGIVKPADAEEVWLVIESLNKAAVINYHEGNYRHAYELLIRALALIEETGEDAGLIKIYTNIGNIYYRFKAYDRARHYYSMALSLQPDSVSLSVLYNNMGAIGVDTGVGDSALYYLRKSMQISRSNDLPYLPSSLNSIASLHQRQRQYDSAFYYYRQAIDASRRNNKKEEEAYNLSDMGNLFLETGHPDSARHYIGLSSRVATENNLFPVLTQNHMNLYKIAKSRGADNEALRHFERYTTLWDSIFNASNLDEINRVERIHETSKVDRQIEQLTLEQLVKERTITYQRIMQLILSVALVALSVMFIANISRKRKLNAAYTALVEKNLEQMESGRQPEKAKKGPLLLDASQEELLDRILEIMEDTAVVCDPKFSINVLAVLLQSNYQYVSQVINNGLSKNFRSFRNEYRIREAQRLFSEPDSGKFTIESVAQQVGFRSRSAFREAFMEVTGVNPTFYLRSLRDKSHKNPK